MARNFDKHSAPQVEELLLQTVEDTDQGFVGIGNPCWTNIVSTLLLLGLNVLIAHSIAVYTNYRSLGTTDPGIQALIVLD
jgi:hypothetical protein